MIKEEQNLLERMRNIIPPAPVRFTIDGTPFEFAPLPLGTLLLIEAAKEKLRINQQLMKACPVMALVLAARTHPDQLRTIVALLTIPGALTDMFKERVAFLNEHCTTENLCLLFIIGAALQNYWLSQTPPPGYEGISRHDFWEVPFNQIKNR